MLAGFTIVVMLIVGYAYFHAGLFTAITMCCNVFLAGLVAFNFWEPLASAWEPHLSGSLLDGFEDALALMLLFCATLIGLRMVTNHLNNTVIEYHPLLQQGGGAVLGLATGYLVCGFLVCVLQTLPWQENFLLFEGQTSEAEPGIRSLLPPDRVWLSLMRWTGASPLARRADDRSPEAGEESSAADTFDRYDTFEIRYRRYRRYGDTRGPLKYQGEFDRELQRSAP